MLTKIQECIMYNRYKALQSLSTFASVKIHPLFQAILDKTPKQVEKIIDSGADVNMRTLDGRKTPLHVAVHRGDLSMVQMLLRKKADVMAVTDGGFTPLHVAAQNNHTKIIDELVSAGSLVNAMTKVGCTPLHESAAKGCKEATLRLLELKADPNIKDLRYNLTPANLAMQNGHVPTLTSLLENMTFQDHFIQNVNFILFNWRSRFPENSLENLFIHQLVDKCKLLNEADQVFMCLNIVLKSEGFIAVQEKFKDMKKGLIVLMKKYNEAKSSSAKEHSGALESGNVETTSTEDESKTDKETEMTAGESLTVAFDMSVNASSTLSNSTLQTEVTVENSGAPIGSAEKVGTSQILAKVEFTH